MKKTILRMKAFAVFGLMAALFVGCGGSSDDDEEESTKSESIEEENKVDSLAVLKELDAEYEMSRQEYISMRYGDPMEMPQIYARDVMDCRVTRDGKVMTQIGGYWHECPIESVKHQAMLFLTPCREKVPPRESDVKETVQTETVAPEETESPSLPCLRNYPDNPEVEDEYVDGFGRVPVSKGLVFLLKDDDCPSSVLNEVRKELIGAVLEMRNIQSAKYYGRSYFELSAEERKKIAQMIPMSIIEARPGEVYETPPPPPPAPEEPEWDMEEIDVVSEEEIAAAERAYEEQFPEEFVEVVKDEFVEEIGEEIVKVPDKMAEFPGGEEALLKYLAENIKYPELARANGITGKVYLRFVVEKDGRITNAKVVRDIGGGCGSEALRVVKSMPKWKPGKVNGKSVRSEFNLPVNFSLRK